MAPNVSFNWVNVFPGHWVRDLEPQQYYKFLLRVRIELSGESSVSFWGQGHKLKESLSCVTSDFAFFFFFFLFFFRCAKRRSWQFLKPSSALLRRQNLHLRRLRRVQFIANRNAGILQGNNFLPECRSVRVHLRILQLCFSVTEVSSRWASTKSRHETCCNCSIFLIYFIQPQVFLIPGSGTFMRGLFLKRKTISITCHSMQRWGTAWVDWQNLSL